VLYLGAVLMRAGLAVVGLALALAGCQTTEQSLASAEYVCQRSGLQPGTRKYAACLRAGYVENRRQADSAASAVAVGAAAGLIGGAAIASSARPYYYDGPYYSPYYYSGYCDAWGCY
jgi:hypothetical protein